MEQGLGAWRVLLLAGVLLSAGCVGLPAGRDDPNTNAAVEPADATDNASGRPEANLTTVEESFPHNASWISDDIEGDLTVRVTVTPANATTCGWAYGAAGVAGGDNEVGVLGRDSLNETRLRAGIDLPNVELLGDRVAHDLEGRWAVQTTGETNVSSPLWLFLSGFGLQSWKDYPALKIVIGCEEPFSLAVEAGSEEVFPLSDGRFGGEVGVETGTATEASFASGRTLEQTANRTIVALEPIRSSSTLEEGQIDVRTPASATSRSFSGEFEPIWLEDGPGSYEMEVQRVAVGGTQMIGTVAGIGPVGDSLADLEAWAQQRG